MQISDEPSVLDPRIFLGNCYNFRHSLAHLRRATKPRNVAGKTWTYFVVGFDARLVVRLSPNESLGDDFVSSRQRRPWHAPARRELGSLFVRIITNHVYNQRFSRTLKNAIATSTGHGSRPGGRDRFRNRVHGSEIVAAPWWRIRLSSRSRAPLCLHRTYTRHSVRPSALRVTSKIRDFKGLVVGAAGFEPTTWSTQNSRATRLRYAPALPPSLDTRFGLGQQAALSSV
jgi:hypothetical protein